MRNINKKLAKLGRYKWTIHNVIAHPLSEVFHLLGYSKLGNKIHDITIPEHIRGQGRG
jgi:hypothetical protein